MELFTPSSVEDDVVAAIRTVKPSLAAVPMTAASSLNRLGLSSMDKLTVVFEVEEKFGVSIVDLQLDHFDTIGEARDIVLRLLSSKEAEARRSAGAEA